MRKLVTIAALAASLSFATVAGATTVHNSGHNFDGGRSGSGQQSCGQGRMSGVCWNQSSHSDFDRGPRFGEGFKYEDKHQKDRENCEDDSTDNANDPPVTPLPAGLPLLLGGLGAFAVMRRKRG